jgi:hypothetical protein
MAVLLFHLLRPDMAPLKQPQTVHRSATEPLSRRSMVDSGMRPLLESPDLGVVFGSKAG